MVKHPSLSNNNISNMMKRAIYTVLVLIMSFGSILAQDYEPTTSWPYLYSDFTEGEIKSMSHKDKSGVFNIHVLHNRLHFIDGKMIREVNPSEVVSVRIESDIYTNVNGEMLKVLAMDDEVYVVEKNEIDVVSLNSTGGAYGSSSSTLSTTAFSSLESIGNGMTAVNHMDLKNSKDEGKSLPLLKKLYIVIPGKVIYATRKDVVQNSGIDVKTINTFIKQNKIKWKDPNSLLILAAFINDNNK